MSRRSRALRVLVILGLLVQLVVIGQASVVANAQANPAFERTWARTDQPVADGRVVRTWMWGPEPFSDSLLEPYIEGDQAKREVQYFDKSRIEINDRDAVDDGLWYVSNGLLVVELVTGELQVGDLDFVPLRPAEVNVAGDLTDPTGPTYATFTSRLDDAPATVGSTITTRIDRSSNVTVEPSLSSRGVTAAIVDDVTHHAIAAPFWTFMTSSGLVLVDGQLVGAPLFENAYYATGRPITEAYWATVQVNGSQQDVLVQCFERRCLTYTPDNPADWQVEMGNVGLHYYTWRYGSDQAHSTNSVTAGEDTRVSLDDEVSVSIEADSVTDDGVLSIVPVDAPDANEQLTPVSQAYDVQLHGAEITSTVTLTIAYDPNLIPDDVSVDELVIAFYDEAANVWRPIPAQVDATTRTATVETDHLSIWQVFSPSSNNTTPPPPTPPPPPTGGNQSPVLDLNGAPSGTGTSSSFVAGDGPVAIAANVVISDADDAELTGARIVISNRVDSASELLTVDVTGTTINASYNAATGVLSLSGAASLADYQQVLATTTYMHTDADPTSGIRRITASVNDGDDDSNVAIAVVMVSGGDVPPPPPPPGNTPPTADDQSITVAEDDSATITLTGDDTDGDALTFSVAPQPEHGTLTGTAPNLIYAPDANHTGIDSFTFIATDGNGGTDTGTVSITVTPVNDAPVTTNDAYSTPEDTPLSVAAPGVLGNDTDIDGNILTSTIVTAPAHGSVTLNATGAFSYTPAADFTGTDTFTYTVSDGTATAGPATVTITIGSSNDAPVAIDDTYATDEDVTLTVAAATDVLANDSDIDGRTLSAVLVDQPGHAVSLTLHVDGSFVYVPEANYAGTDTFTYTVSDGGLNSSPATVTITLTGFNDAPTASDQAVSNNEDVTFDITLIGTDIDADPVTYSLVDMPTNGTAILDGTIVIYTPNANLNGSDSFTFKINDGQLDSNTATISITTHAVNDAPTAEADNYTVDEDGVLVVDGQTLAGVLNNDTDIDTASLTAVLDAQPQYGQVSLQSNGTFTYTPNADFIGTDSFTYRADDGQALSGITTVSITVNPVNDAPSASAVSATTTEDAPATITLTGTDIDGDGVSFKMVDGVSNGLLGDIVPASCKDADEARSCTAAITYTPQANSTGSVTFPYSVSDGTLTSNTATVSINITEVNDSPVAVGDSYNTDEDTQLTVAATGVLGNDTDIENDTLTAEVVTGVAHGILNLNPDGSFTYTPNANFFGDDSFTYRANDATLDSGTVTVTIAVGEVNDAPTAVEMSESTNEDESVTITLAGTDVDGDTLTFTASPPTTGTGALGTVSSSTCAEVNETGVSICTATVTYDPETNYNGPSSFTFSVTDGTDTSTPVMVSIDVTAVNDTPVAAGESYDTNEDEPLTAAAADGVLDNDTDVENDELTARIATQASHGIVSLDDDGSFVYTPNANYHGSDSFTYVANDGNDDSGPATVTLTINAVNDAPTASDQTVSTNEDGASNITLTASDVDGDSLTYSTVDMPVNGIATISGSSVSYTPNASFHGSDSLTFRANDGDLDSNTATISITVNPVNDPPMLTVNPGPVQFIGDATALDASATITDMDSPDFDTGTLSVTITGNAHTSDQLALLSTGGISLLGPEVRFNGTTIGTITGGAIGTGTLVVTFNAQATAASVQALVRALAYDKASDAADSNVERTVSVIVADGDGGDSGTKTVRVIFNQAPTALSLSNNTVAENATAGTTIGTFTTTDPDGDTAFTYSLVAGTGDTDNASFDISGNTLITQAVFDHEARDTYSIRVQTSDGNGGLFSDTFTITVTNINEPPVIAVVEPVTIKEYTGADEDTQNGDTVTSMSASDPEGQSITWSIEGGNTNNAFAIDANGAITVATETVLDYEIEANRTFTLTARATDSGTEASETTVTVNLENIDEAPTVQNQQYGYIEESNSSTGTLIGNVRFLTGPDEGLLVSASDPEGGVLAITTVESYANNTPNGTLTPNSDGSFTYDPPVGFKANADTFSVTVQDPGGNTATGIVSFYFANTRVWFVDNSYGGATSDGRSETPFKTIGDLSGKAAIGDTIYLATGSYAGGLTLLDNQILIGEGAVGASFASLAGVSTLPSRGSQDFPDIGGTKPTITNTGSSGLRALTLAKGNTVRGLTLGQSTGAALSGSGGGASVVIDNVSITGPDAYTNTVTGPAVALSGYQNASISFDDITRSNITGTAIGLSNLTGSSVSITGMLTVSIASGSGIVLSSAGTFSVSSTDGSIIANGGTGLSITSTALSSSGVTLGNVSSTYTGWDVQGIVLSDVSGGALTISGGSISNVYNTAIQIGAGSSDISIGADITSSQANAVFIYGRSGGAVTLSGSIANSGAGITVRDNMNSTITFSGSSKTITTTADPAVTLSNNSGTTVNFTNGGLAITTGTGTGFSVTDSGTVFVSGAGNTISSTGGVALNVANTTIGSGGLQFQSISADGGPNGIVLNTTGSLAGLAITGDGSPLRNASGGTIQNMTGDGIVLTATSDVSLAQININNTDGSGIEGTGVVDFSLTHSTISDSGSVPGDSNISFSRDSTGLNLTTNNVSGEVTIVGNALTDAFAYGIDIYNFSGTLDSVTISGNTITSPLASGDPNGSGIRLAAQEASNVVKATISSNTITGFTGNAGIDVRGDRNDATDPAVTFGVAGSLTSVIAITENTIGGFSETSRIGTHGIVALVGGTGQGNFAINGNDVRHTVGATISTSAFGNVTVTTLIDGNTVVANNQFSSQGITGGTGSSYGDPTTAPSLTVTVTNNSVSRTDGSGIDFRSREASGTMHAKIQNNLVEKPLGTGISYGITVHAGSSTGNSTVCLNISGNTATGSTSSTGTITPGIGLRKQGTSTAVNVFGINGMSATSSPGIENYVNGLNPGSAAGTFGIGGTALISAASGFSNCSLP